MIDQAKLTMLAIKLKQFTNDPESYKFIRYDWDCGHAYSYVDHSIVSEVEDTPLEQALYDWQYNNDVCPPCHIHVYQDGTATRGCCDGSAVPADEVKDIISELTDYYRQHEDMYGLKYAVTYADYGEENPYKKRK